MQTITFLVTLAEASQSDDPSIIEQIPKKLRKSRTLLLCPPTLVENWKDEWRQWQPDTEPVGPVRTTTETATRLTNIRAWFEGGGVLLMGYELVRLAVCRYMRVLSSTFLRLRSQFMASLEFAQSQLMTRSSSPSCWRTKPGKSKEESLQSL